MTPRSRSTDFHSYFDNQLVSWFQTWDIWPLIGPLSMLKFLLTSDLWVTLHWFLLIFWQPVAQLVPDLGYKTFDGTFIHVEIFVDLWPLDHASLIFVYNLTTSCSVGSRLTMCDLWRDLYPRWSFGWPSTSGSRSTDFRYVITVSVSVKVLGCGRLEALKKCLQF